MRILLTNDDGPFGHGLCSLREAMEDFGEVTVVCPAEERSGVSHSITYLAPVRSQSVRLRDGAPATLLTGAPADCVKFAMLEVFDSPPDLVVSGINLGCNAGVDLFYSGTVAAAVEGAFYGVTSVAVSTARGNADRMEEVARQARRVLDVLLDSSDQAPRAYSVNIPALAAAGPDPEIRITVQSRAFPPGEFVRGQGPRGREHYFLDSTTGAGPAQHGSDVAALAAGAISVTPLRADLSDADAAEELRARLTATADTVD